MTYQHGIDLRMKNALSQSVWNVQADMYCVVPSLELHIIVESRKCRFLQTQACSSAAVGIRLPSPPIRLPPVDRSICRG